MLVCDGKFGAEPKHHEGAPGLNAAQGFRANRYGEKPEAA
jgi:hypothetical protein